MAQTHYFANLDLHGALALPTWCPHCHADELQPVSTGERVNFFCPNCHRCWHMDLARLHTVCPQTCERCALWPQCTRVVPDPAPEGPT